MQKTIHSLNKVHKIQLNNTGQLAQSGESLHEGPAAKALNDTLHIQVREQYRAFYYAAAAYRALLPPVCGFDQTRRAALHLSSTPHLSAERRAYSQIHICQDAINATTCQPSNCIVT